MMVFSLLVLLAHMHAHIYSIQICILNKHEGEDIERTKFGIKIIKCTHTAFERHICNLLVIIKKRGERIQEEGEREKEREEVLKEKKIRLKREKQHKE